MASNLSLQYQRYEGLNKVYIQLALLILKACIERGVTEEELILKACIERGVTAEELILKAYIER